MCSFFSRCNYVPHHSCCRGWAGSGRWRERVSRETSRTKWSCLPASWRHESIAAVFSLARAAGTPARRRVDYTAVKLCSRKSDSREFRLTSHVCVLPPVSAPDTSLPVNPRSLLLTTLPLRPIGTGGSTRSPLDCLHAPGGRSVVSGEARLGGLRRRRRRRRGWWC